MGFIVLLFICYMITLGVDWRTIDSGYVKHASTADSTLEFLDNPPLVISGLVPELFNILGILIADSILVRDLFHTTRVTFLSIRLLDLAMLGHLESVLDNHHPTHLDDCRQPRYVLIIFML
jgi:hypothetical protein